MRNQILDYVQENFDLDLKRNTRQREYSEARCLYYALCRKHSLDSLKVIGKSLDRDHSTVAHSLNNVWPILSKDKKYMRIFNEFEILDTDKLEAKELRRINLVQREEIETLKKLIVKEGDRFNYILRGLNEEQLDNIYDRLQAMVIMERKKETYKINTKEMEGALE